MVAKLRSRLTYANVMSSLAVFLVVSGGLAIAAQPNSVISGDIVDGEVKNPDLAPNSVGTGKVIDNSLSGADIAAGAIGSSEIAAGAVGSQALANGAVGSQALANGAVGSEALANGAVGSGKLAAGAVGSQALASGAVGSGKIADRAVLSEKIALGTIQDANIALATITGSRLAGGTISQREIGIGGVGSPEIAPGAVHQPDIAENGVASSEIAGNAVGSSEIASGAVGTSEHASLPGARVQLGPQTIEDDTNATGFNCEVLRFGSSVGDLGFNRGDMFRSSSDRSNLHVPTDGIYALTATVGWAQASGNYSVRFDLPDASPRPVGQRTRDADRGSLSDIVRLQAGDLLSVEACHDAFGASRSVQAGSYFAAQWLGP